MNRKLIFLARAVVYLLALVVPPVLVGVVGVKAGLSDRYEGPPPAATAQAGELPASPEHDPDKPTAVVLLSNRGSEVTDVLAPYEVLSESGAFNVYAVAPERRAVTLSGGLDVLPQLSFEELDRRLEGGDPDVVVVPAMWDVGSAGHRPVAEWLREHAGGTGTVMSVCDGAEVLANAGLLDGRRATANWANISRWEGRYPEAEWERGRRYVEDGNVTTAAGVTSGVSATLHVVRGYVGEEDAADLARKIGYPDQRLGEEPRIPADRLSLSDRALYVLGGAYGWDKPRVGVVLNEGASEIELASVFDAYPGPAFTSKTTSLAPGGPRSPVESEHGLFFVPRHDLEGAPLLDRLLVPGRDAAPEADPAVRSWARGNGLKPEYVHADASVGASAGFPFDATLRDLAEHENVPVAKFLARLLEYPTGHLDLAGSGWPFAWLLRPLAVGLLGLAAVAALDRLVRGSGGEASPPLPRKGRVSGWSARRRIPRVSDATGLEAMGPAETETLEKGGQRMERNTDTGGAAPDGLEATTAPGGAAGLAGAASPATDGRARGRLVTGWRFARHLLEMVVAMVVGMGAFGLALAGLGEPPGYANLLVRYGLMGVSMAAPMVAWMRFRGHTWRDGGEMAAAMLLPMLAPVALVEAGAAVPGLTEGSLMVISHAAMVGGMVALMLYRFERYAHASHAHLDEKDDTRTARTTKAKEARR